MQHPGESDDAYNERITLDAQRIAEILVNNAKLRSEHTEEKKENLEIETFASTFDMSGITSPEAITPITQESSSARNLTSFSVVT